MKTFWSVPEACVWAATLEAEAVDVVSASDLEGVHFLMEDALPIGYAAHVIAWRSHALEAAGAGLMPSAWEAFSALKDLCADGVITMHGVERGAGDSGPIPADAWAKLKLDSTGQWGLVAAACWDGGRLNFSARWWNNLTIRRANVLKVWPPVVAPAETSMRAVATEALPPELDDARRAGAVAAAAVTPDPITPMPDAPTATAAPPSVPVHVEPQDDPIDQRERVKDIVKRIEQENRQLTRSQFMTWFGDPPFGLPQSELIDLWRTVPKQWRADRQGRLADARRVKSLEKYL